MREITYRQALNEALAEELERDPNVFLMGEEVAEYKAPTRSARVCSSALVRRRIIDTPISENGFAGLGVGAAMVGLRPIIEFMTFSFSLVAFDQVVNNAPNMLTMSGGQFNIPITFRGPNGPAHQLGATHSHATEMLLRQRAGTENLHAGDAARRERIAENGRPRQQSGSGFGSGACSTAQREWWSRRMKSCSFRSGKPK